MKWLSLFKKQKPWQYRIRMKEGNGITEYDAQYKNSLGIWMSISRDPLTGRTNWLWTKSHAEDLIKQKKLKDPYNYKITIIDND